jgi:hypothetical protein
MKTALLALSLSRLHQILALGTMGSLAQGLPEGKWAGREWDIQDFIGMK